MSILKKISYFIKKKAKSISRFIKFKQLKEKLIKAINIFKHLKNLFKKKDKKNIKKE